MFKPLAGICLELGQKLIHRYLGSLLAGLGTTTLHLEQRGIKESRSRGPELEIW